MGSPRPIVYSARYYTSPRHAERRSYFHLYRIEPDGTGRRQLTDAHADDRAVSWSPDGESIAFIRTMPEFRETLGTQALCACDPAGSVRELLRGEDLSFHWAGPGSLRVEAAGHCHRIDVGNGRRITTHPGRVRAISPNFRYALTEEPNGILQLGGGVRVALPTDVDETVWLTSTRILGRRTRETVSIVEFGLDGKVRREGKADLLGRGAS